MTTHMDYKHLYASIVRDLEQLEEQENENKNQKCADISENV